MIGTPRICLQSKPGELDLVGPAADQYAVGMMLYEMICLEQARQGITVLKLLDKAIEGTREWSLSEMDPRLTIILKSTEPAVEDRYATMRDLALDLRLYLQDKAVTAFKEPFLMGIWRRLEDTQCNYIGGQ